MTYISACKVEWDMVASIGKKTFLKESSNWDQANPFLVGHCLYGDAPSKLSSPPWRGGWPACDQESGTLAYFAWKQMCTILQTHSITEEILAIVLRLFKLRTGREEVGLIQGHPRISEVFQYLRASFLLPLDSVPPWSDLSLLRSFWSLTSLDIKCLCFFIRKDGLCLRVGWLLSYPLLREGGERGRISHISLLSI